MAEVLGVAVSVLAVLQISSQVWSACWGYLCSARDATYEIKYLMESITALQKVFQRVEYLAQSPDTTKLINIPSTRELISNISWELREQFRQLLDVLGEKKSKSRTWKLRRRLKWPLKKEDVERTLQLLERHKTSLITAMNCDQITALAEMGTQIEESFSQKQRANLLKLSDESAKGAAHNHYLWQHEDHCLEYTRLALRQQITEWYDNPDPSSECIFWLNGMAGTGKSTISRTVARELASRQKLGASFFFSRGRGDISNATKFFITIASQLADNLPVLRTPISNAIDENMDIFNEGLTEHWKQLILNPLKNAPTQSIQLVVVIDALDECDNIQDVQLILQLLAEAKTLNTIRLRIFVTSRPETHILLGFGKLPGQVCQDFILHSIPLTIVNEDISIFFQQKLSLVKAQHGLKAPWPDEEKIQKLVEKAAGLFIYAATTCRFIEGDDDPEEQLALILRDGTSSGLNTKHLDEMYTTLLRRSVDGKPDREGLVTPVLGSIVTMFDILPARCLAKLLEIPERRVLAILGSLRSVLSVPEDENQPVKIFHLSFRDFLVDSQRCSDPKFLIYEEHVHATLFQQCMGVISKLQENMCNLTETGILAVDIPQDIIAEKIPPHVQYACCYWFEHFQKYANSESDHNAGSRDNPTQDYSSRIKKNIRIIQEFLELHFLHWLEALSLIGEVSNGVLSLIALEDILTGKLKSYADSKLWDFAYDAKRYILYNRSMIEMAPLQIYYSGLLFNPTTSLIQSRYLKERSTWITIQSDRETAWGSLIQTLEGHTHGVTSVAFSPNGKIIASASDDKTVRLWDPLTGKQYRILEGHTDEIKSVAFSPDGKIVASASYDKTVRLWDPLTGTQCGAFEGHTHGVISVAFSPNGEIIASASHDNTVRLWEVSTGMEYAVLEGRSVVKPVVFSPDANLVACASSNTTIKVWDRSKEKQYGLFEFKGHTDNIKSVAFSPDGNLVATASDDKTVRLWDPSTAKQCGVLEGHTDFVQSAIFSPDGKLVVSISTDQTLRLWDPFTKQQCRVLTSHEELYEDSSSYSIVFSPNGKLIASTFGGNTISLWDPSTGEKCGTLAGHHSFVTSLVFSPDGKFIASTANDRTVKLWDLVQCDIDTVDITPIYLTAFSADGKIVASVYDNDPFCKLWNPSTGTQYGVLEGHIGPVQLVVFAPEGNLIASACEDNIVRLWDRSTGKQCRVLEGHTNRVRSIAFSPDGTLIATASDDGTVRVWNPSTGKQCRIIKGHTHGVTSVAFSPNGEVVASASYDKTVRLWNVSTGKQYKVLQGHTDCITSVVFSPDGRLVASASYDKTVRLWDPFTEKQYAVLDDHQGQVLSVAFSPNGEFVKSTSIDDTVRMWYISDCGALKPKSTSCGSIPCPEPVQMNLWLSYFGGSWVMCNMKKLLWLPCEYRSIKVIAIDGNTIAIFPPASSHSIDFISINLTSLPPAYRRPPSYRINNVITGKDSLD